MRNNDSIYCLLQIPEMMEHPDEVKVYYFLISFITIVMATWNLILSFVRWPVTTCISLEDIAHDIITLFTKTWNSAYFYYY